MQGLLALREAGHDETDEENQSRENFREVATGGAGERYTPAFEIRDLQSQGHFAQGRLIRRAFQRGFVDPVGQGAERESVPDARV